MPQDGSAYKGTGTRRAFFLGACLFLAVVAALSAAVVLSGKSNPAPKESVDSSTTVTVQETLPRSSGTAPETETEATENTLQTSDHAPEESETTAPPTTKAPSKVVPPTTKSTSQAPPETTKKSSVTEPKVALKPATGKQKQMLDLINAERKKAGVPALIYRSDLQSAADVRARELVQSPVQTRPDGRKWDTVFADTNHAASVGAYRAQIVSGVPFGLEYPQFVFKNWQKEGAYPSIYLDTNYTGIVLATAESEEKQMLYAAALFVS